MKLNYLKTLFVAILVIFATTTNAATNSGSCGINVNWSYDGLYWRLIITGTGEMRDYSYPNTPWYSYKSKIYGVIIGTGVTSIGRSAFSDCTGLTSVTIPNSITSIGDDAFYGCSGLTSVTIPNSVTSIGRSAFSDCTGLTSVTIGNGVTSIGNGAFYGCSSLTSIDVASDNANYSSIDGVLFNKDKTQIVKFPEGKKGEYVIPNSVTSIGNSAFEDCSGLTSVTIPNSITSIGDDAFYGCSGLTSISIPNSVTSIGDYAFRGCSGLTSVTIGNGVTSIGVYAFYNCIGLERITSLCETPPMLGGNTFYYLNGSQNKPLSEIPVYVFTDVSKYKVSLGWDKFNNYITQIPPFDFAMLNGDDKSIYYRVANSNDLLNQRVSVIKGEEAYRGNINIPDTVNYIGINFSVTSIGDAAFSESNIVEIGLPQTLEKIGDEAFYGCSRLRNMTYPESLKSIGVSAFEDCIKMTEVVLCENVEKIEAYAFAGCTGLTNVYSLNPVPPVCDVDAFYGIGVEVQPMTLNKAVTNVSLYVPEGSVSAYQAAPEWCNFYNIVASNFVGIEDFEIDTNSDKPNAYISGGVLMLTGIEMPTNVAVYNLSGTNVANVMVTPDNCSINLSNLPKGIYIVAIKGNAHKVIL